LNVGRAAAIQIRRLHPKPWILSASLPISAELMGPPA
jgi:hypothetical protein